MKNSNHIVFKKDSLGKDRIFPCTIKEIEAIIDCLPFEYARLITKIRLNRSRKNKGPAISYKDKREIHIFSFPKHLCVGVYNKKKPKSNIVKELLDWGAHLYRHDSCWYLYWDNDNLKNYILKHVLLHEIGHLVGNSKFQRKKEQEQYAEKFAIEMCRKFFVKGIGVKP